MKKANIYKTTYRFKKINRAILSFWLIGSLVCISSGLPENAFAVQKIPKNLAEKLKSITKIKPTITMPAAIGEGSKTSVTERKISSKISGGLGCIVRSKMRFPKGSVFPQARTVAPAIDAERISVIFELSPEGIDLAELASRGVRIKKQYKNLIEAEINPENIESVVEEFNGIRYARLPRKFFPLDVTSEGVSLSGATDFHDEDYKGQGVKVAVIDVGFKGLTDAQANGDLPANVITHDYSGNGLQTQYKHGTACAEIVHDMAPEAELYLLKIGGGETDFYDAVDYCIAEGIDVISFSLGTFRSGPGNGTGLVCEKADEARDAGILWVSAAGNSGQETIYDLQGNQYLAGHHWKGSFRDTNNDNKHEFQSGNSNTYFVQIFTSPPQKDDDGTPETDELSVLLRWNDWPESDIDYDLYLYDNPTNWNLIDSSTGSQDGIQPPTEYIERDVPPSSTDGEAYVIVIKRKSGEPKNIEMELIVSGTCILYPYYTASSSICEPADAESVFTVGAIDYENWTTGPQEDFSSQGPTNAWAGSSARVKPDIAGPDRVSTYTSRDEQTGFMGTSAATPHVAGAAALLLSADPSLSVDGLQTLLETNAVNMGASGKDNLYGWGRLDMPEPPDYSDVVINEFVPNPDGSNVEWVELYNKGNDTIDISGCYIDDVTTGGGNPVQIPDGTTITAGGFYSLTVYSGDGYFNNSGDTVNFLAPNGATLLDSKTHGDVSAFSAHSIYRYPDGGSWAGDMDNTPTRDASNDGPTTIDPGKCLISGYVYDDSGNPIDNMNAWVSLYDNGGGAAGTSTGPNGYYYINNLDPGDYRAGAGNQDNYYPKYYNDRLNYQNADRVTVAAGETRGGINFNLEQGGTISGHVYEEGGTTPIPDENVFASSYDDSSINFGTTTNTNGYYLITVPFGNYRAGAGGENSEYLREYYSGHIDWDDADEVQVTVGNPNIGSIDFTLEQGTASISGTVYDHSGAAIGNIEVWYESDLYDYGKGDQSNDPTGAYSLTALPRGLAEVAAGPDSGNTTYAMPSRDVYLQSGQPLTGFNFHLRQGALITGRLTVPGDSSNPNNVLVNAYGGHFDDTWAESEYSANPGDGYYAMRLVPGEFRIGVLEEHEHYLNWPQHITVSNTSDDQTVDMTLYRVPDDCPVMTGTLTIDAAYHSDSRPMIAGMESGTAASLAPGDSLPNPVTTLSAYNGTTDEYTMYVIPDHTYDAIFGFYNESDESFESFTVIDVVEDVAVAGVDINGPDFSFTSVGGEVTGTVTAEREPVLMALVTIFDSTNNRFVGWAYSDQNGVYHIYNVPPGDYVAYGDQRDYMLSDSVDASGVTNGGSITVNISLPLPNASPVLSDGSVAPPSGTVVTAFTYTVTYTDEENEAPTSITVSLDGGAAQAMTKVTPGDDDYTDGCDYEYGHVGLAKGSHTYQFAASDGTSSATGDTGSHSGPTVNNTPPSASNLSLAPALPKTGDNLTGSYDYSDPDGDTESGTKIRWYKGGVHQATYDDTLQVPKAATSKGELWHFTVKPKDGTSFGSLKTSASVTIQNSAPSVTSAAISPDPAYTDQNLTATPSGWSDADNDAEGYNYQWQKKIEGTWQDIQGATTNTLNNSNFQRDDQIKVIATPDDGETLGTPKEDVITISNSPPTITGVIVSPDPAQTNSILTAAPQGWQDADEDPEGTYFYEWHNQQGVIDNEISSTLAGDNFVKGDQIHCEVIPNDGISDGESKTSNTVAILNTPPTQPQDVTVSPATPTTGEDLTCTASGSTDIDGDTVSYQYLWHEGGVAVPDQTSSTLSSSQTSEGEDWTCVVTPTDGEDNGTSKTSNEVNIAADLSIAPVSATVWAGMTQQFNVSGGTPPYIWGCNDGNEGIGMVGAQGLFSALKSGACSVEVTDSNNRLAASPVDVPFPALGWQENVVCVEDGDQTSPAISGNVVVWLDHTASSNVYMYDISTGTETTITDDDDTRSVPDISGDKVVWGNAGDVYMYNITTGAQETIYTSGNSLRTPRISGNRIVWEELNEDYDVAMYDINTGMTAIYVKDGDQRSPAISGNRMVWSDNRNGLYDIFAYDFSTEDETAICTNEFTQRSPAVSGDKIVWIDDRNGSSDVYMYDLSTEIESVITSSLPHQTNLSIDGDKIVYQDYRLDENENIIKEAVHIYHIPTGIGTVLSIAPGEQWVPDISDDIAVYSDNRNGNWDIFAVELFFGNPSIVLKDPATESSEYTNSQTVNVELDVTNGTEYMISENPDFAGESRISSTFPVTIPYTFGTSVNETKVVYAKFKNELGLETDTTNDTIILDTENPILNSISLSDQASGLTAKTASPTVDVAINASGAPTEMILSENPGFTGANWQNYAASMTLNLSQGDGGKTVYCKVRDAALNESATVSDSITLDTTPPSAPSPFLALCAVNSRDVNLSWQNPQDADFAETMIRRKTGGYPADINDGVEVYRGSGQFFIDAVAQDETTYYYSAWARDDIMNRSSISAQAEITSGDTIVPYPVENFTATANSSVAAINLTWNPPGLSPDYAGVKILRKTGSYPTGLTDGDEIYDGPGTSYTDAGGLSEYTRYYYAAFSYDEVRNYGTSALADAVTNDLTGPYVDIDSMMPEIPEDGSNAIQVPPDTNIIFHLKDDGTGVDISSLSLVVNGQNINIIDPVVVAPADRDAHQPYALFYGNPNDYTVVYDTEDDYKCEEDVDVSITADDFAGTPNSCAYNCTFTTAMMTVSSNTRVSDVKGAVDRDNSSIAASSSGKEIFVVWEEDNGNGRDIYFAKSVDRGHTFGQDVMVSNGIGDMDRRYPAIAVNNSGNEIYVVWQEKDLLIQGSDWDVYIAKSSGGGTSFEEPVRVDDNEGLGNQMYPVIDIKSAGKVYVAWIDDRNESPAIYFAKSTDDRETFGENIQVDDGSIELPEPLSLAAPSLRVDQGGDVFIAWSAGGEGNKHIYFDKYTKGNPQPIESFGTDVLVDEGNETSDATNPTLDVRPNGKDICIAWQNLAEDGDEDIYFAKSTDSGATFGDAVQVNEDSETPEAQKNPTLAIDNNGDIYVAWHDRRNSEPESGDQGDIYIAQSMDKGQSFNTNVLLNDDTGTAIQSMPSIALDANGKHANVCWTDRRNGAGDIYFCKNTVINVIDSFDVDCNVDETFILDDPASNLNGAEVEFPTGALEINMTVTIGEIDNPPNPPEGGFGVPIHLGPSGLTFDIPVTVTVPYGDSNISGDTIEVYYYDLTINGWSNEGITFGNIDRVARTITFTTTHFSMFGFGSGSGGGISGGGGANALVAGLEGCFIATAAYGTPMAEDVLVLSEFRDKYLLTNSFGRKFVSVYYKLSPPIADYILKRESLKAIIRALLKPLIWFSRLAT